MGAAAIVLVKASARPARRLPSERRGGRMLAQERTTGAAPGRCLFAMAAGPFYRAEVHPMCEDVLRRLRAAATHILRIDVRGGSPSVCSACHATDGRSWRAMPRNRDTNGADLASELRPADVLRPDPDAAEVHRMHGSVAKMGMNFRKDLLRGFVVTDLTARGGSTRRNAGPGTGCATEGV